MRNISRLTVDELWDLHEEVGATLSEKLNLEKQQLESRLIQLNGPTQVQPQNGRRPYPKVVQKYGNPDKPDETWSGRGRQPLWVGAQLRKGKKIEDLLVPHLKSSSVRGKKAAIRKK
jgi:DNA-binding protein H-NS